MLRRTPREARTLGLWTAGWLFALLLAGVLWIGDLAVQWPVLLVPLMWALVALRPRRPAPDPRPQPPRAARPGRVHRPRPDPAREPGPHLPRGGRGLPPDHHPQTREVPWIPDVPPRAEDRREG